MVCEFVGVLVFFRGWFEKYFVREVGRVRNEGAFRFLEMRGWSRGGGGWSSEFDLVMFFGRGIELLEA